MSKRRGFTRQVIVVQEDYEMKENTSPKPKQLDHWKIISDYQKREITNFICVILRQKAQHLEVNTVEPPLR